MIWGHILSKYYNEINIKILPLFTQRDVRSVVSFTSKTVYKLLYLAHKYTPKFSTPPNVNDEIGCRVENSQHIRYRNYYFNCCCWFADFPLKKNNERYYIYTCFEISDITKPCGHKFSTYFNESDINCNLSRNQLRKEIQ